jgi:glycosyltransferase involved in cell wall biosynthesis
MTTAEGDLKTQDLKPRDLKPRDLNATPQAPRRVCVGLATRGRPRQIGEIVSRMRRQTQPAATILVVCVEPADVEGLADAPDLRVVYAAPGLTRQRNAVLDNLPDDTDYVVFFDDDFVPDDRWLEVVAAQFEADPTIVGVTGHVVADGILGPGLTFEEAAVAVQTASRDGLDWRLDGYSPYGCNMAFRVGAIEGRRFDERLVLYGWLEDRDFGARLADAGRLVKLGAAFGAHMGVKRGRVSGKRLGYSQIVNPVYLNAKGSMSTRSAARQALRNVAANLAKSPWPERYIDRRGRLLGNALALVDLAKGVCEPERAERL